jgi:metal-sulfur cluster biosynthetic enzyme
MSARPDSHLDPDIRDALQDVLDPEIGLSVVDLGLVYRAVREVGRIAVDLTLTTRACPLGELIAEQARACLESRFGSGGPIEVRLVWEPLWSPDFITENGRAQLGRF